MAVQISESCIGCGACIRDCARQALVFKGSLPTVMNNTICNRCGHCVAVCPVNAVTISEYDMTEARPLQPNIWQANPTDMLELIRSRRSIRHYTSQPVEPEKLNRIIEAGRYAPTASNSQKNRFIIVSETLPQLRALLLEQLAKDGEILLQTSHDPVVRNRAIGWVEMYHTFLDDPTQKDHLFFDAPIIITLVSRDMRDGGIVSAYMELMATAEGLGTLYNGIMSNAINECPEAKSLLGIQDHESAAICMLFGYPAVKYHRIAPRNPVNRNVV